MELSHINNEGRARMVDVTDKPVTCRTATAAATVNVNPDTRALIRTGGIKKGDVLAVAQVAGVMAAKKTSDLIPMCHPLALTSVDIHFALSDTSIQIQATVKCRGVTGVEMEALTGVSVALLTFYDMCKAIDKRMLISDIHLVSKSGGKSGDFNY